MSGMRLLHPVRSGLIGLGSAWRRVTGAVTASRVITFHETPDADLFGRRIDWLLQRFEIVPLAQLLTTPKADRVALTFDDGFASWHEVAAPVLRDRGIPATFFICSGFVGLAGHAAERFARERLGRQTRGLLPLSVRQLRELASAEEFEIGSHTHTHADLGALTDRGELAREIGGDRDRLADWTGREIRWFAYPFGLPAHASLESRSLVANSGFEAGFSNAPGFYTADRDRYFLPRDSLDPGASDWRWRHWLRGGYDGWFSAKERLRSRLTPARTVSQ